MTTSAVAYPANHSYTRATRANPCPICAHDSWCAVRSDGAVHCMREQSPFADASRAGWWHYPGGDPRNLGLTGYPNAQIGLANHSLPAELLPAKAPAADLDRVYTALLAVCPLLEAHRAYLLTEGFGRDDLSGYGTLGKQRDRACSILAASFSRELLRTVPGLFYTPDDRLAIAAPNGMLVAIRDVDGLIIGMQVRTVESDGSKRYLWLSSVKHQGVSSGSPAHVVNPEYSTVVYVTEGAKKAHRIAVETGYCAIGLPGHGVQQSGLAALSTLADRGALCAVIALDEDADPATAAAVERSRQQLISASLACGLAVRIARWDPATAKGLDDLVQLHQQPHMSAVTGPADSDDPGSGKPGRTLSREEQAARYRAIRRVLWNEDRERRGRSMTPAEKLALLVSYEMTDLYPGTIAAGGCLTPVDLNMGALGRRVGCSAAVAGRTVKDLADAGLLDRRERYEVDSGHKRIAVAPARPLGYNEVLPEPERKAADRARQRCKHCGSESVSTRRICHDCGAVEELQAAAASDDLSDRGGVVDSANAIVVKDPIVISNKKDPMYDSEVGVILQETSPDLYRDQDPMYESEVGLLQSETTMAVATTIPRSADLLPAKHRGLCAPTKLPPVPEQPCSANRPYWGCSRCNKWMWSSVGGQAWFCSNCGEDAGSGPPAGVLVGLPNTRAHLPPTFGSR